ncbi:hypothetical protein [Sphingomicrobium astaxanthinifaciens]|uniref:hypothetical protein n=1 Tax=Sphingomicrobium astaxanthinifaciens TaxID=1227949 RepID=UPI001FCAC6F4|nr:hypothetical protein [Sphingomicrobium astaxanthinifaciens]MCJ7421628.1 hypothetical protein [Sphingomicrobium astaxanthinifaciens]
MVVPVHQRVRVGITGLAVVFLLVLLGTALLKVGGGEERAVVAGSESTPAAPADPLSEIGAAPGMEAEEEDEPIAPLPIPIDPATEELIVNEIAVPPEAQ